MLALAPDMIPNILLRALQIADTEAQQEAQIAHYKEVFNQMDWKGDGVLDEQVRGTCPCPPPCHLFRYAILRCRPR
jgi:hypothetical protein